MKVTFFKKFKCMADKTTRATSTAYYHFILICVKMSAALSIIIFVNIENSEKGKKKNLILV